MEWVGLITQALGVLLYLLKRWSKGVQLKPIAKKAQEVVREGEAEASRFADEISKGDVDKAGPRLDRVLSDLDALGLLSEKGSK